MQGREKIGLVLAFTEMGFDVVVSDVDTVWLQDPRPFLAHYPEADILVSSDSLVSTAPPYLLADLQTDAGVVCGMDITVNSILISEID